MNSMIEPHRVWKKFPETPNFFNFGKILFSVLQKKIVQPKKKIRASTFFCGQEKF